MILSLDDVIEEGPIEDTSIVRARVEYHYSKLLIPRSFRRESIESRRVLHVGVDSSSRIIAVPHALIVVGSAAASMGSTANSVAWPRLQGKGLDDGPPFIALIPLIDHGGAPASRFILVYDSQAARRGAGYGASRVSRELRVAMENWVLENLPNVIESMGRRFPQEGSPVVMLDGPLFMATPLGYDPNSNGHGVSWRRLMESRVRAVELLESMGIPVVGVVKRVENSTILSKTREFVERASRCVSEADAAADLALLYMALRSECGPSGSPIMFTPKISVEYSVEWLPGKIVEYAIIAPSSWHRYSPRAKILRIEATRKSLELLSSMGLDPETVLAGDTIARGSQEPATILASDRLSKTVSNAVKKALVSSLLRGDVPLTYDESRWVERLWRTG